MRWNDVTHDLSGRSLGAKTCNSLPKAWVIRLQVERPEHLLFY